MENENSTINDEGTQDLSSGVDTAINNEGSDDSQGSALPGNHGLPYPSVHEHFELL